MFDLKKLGVHFLAFRHPPPYIPYIPCQEGSPTSPVRGERQAVKVDRMPVVVTGGLGQGGYAVVLKAAHAETHEPFALKVEMPKLNIGPYLFTGP